MKSPVASCSYWARLIILLKAQSKVSSVLCSANWAAAMRRLMARSRRRAACSPSSRSMASSVASPSRSAVSRTWSSSSAVIGIRRMARWSRTRSCRLFVLRSIRRLHQGEIVGRRAGWDGIPADRARQRGGGGFGQRQDAMGFVLAVAPRPHERLEEARPIGPQLGEALGELFVPALFIAARRMLRLGHALAGPRGLQHVPRDLLQPRAVHDELGFRDAHR